MSHRLAQNKTMKQFNFDSPHSFFIFISFRFAATSASSTAQILWPRLKSLKPKFWIPFAQGSLIYLSKQRQPIAATFKLLKCLPIILLTENLRCFTGRPLESFSRRSNALYKLGVLSATETSQNPIPCEAANDAPSDSLTCHNKEIFTKLIFNIQRIAVRLIMTQSPYCFRIHRINLKRCAAHHISDSLWKPKLMLPNRNSCARSLGFVLFRFRVH